MAYLGTPYRILYAAKNFRSGLTDVKAFVVKPDSTVAGLFAMAEMPLLTFAGMYYFDLVTSPTDVEGEWTAMILSPSEGIKDPHRISFQVNPIPSIRLMIANFLANGIKQELLGQVDLSSQFLSYLNSSPELLGLLDPSTTQSFVSSPETQGDISQTIEIKGDPYHGGL